MTSLLADRLTSTVAPASAWLELGGMGTHRSSQISTPSVTPSPSAAKRRSTPNGTVAPRTSTSRLRAAAAAANQRRS